jgi:hypothetical protein
MGKRARFRALLFSSLLFSSLLFSSLLFSSLLFSSLLFSSLLDTSHLRYGLSWVPTIRTDLLLSRSGTAWIFFVKEVKNHGELAGKRSLRSHGWIYLQNKPL